MNRWVGSSKQLQLFGLRGGLQLSAILLDIFNEVLSHCIILQQ